MIVRETNTNRPQPLPVDQHGIPDVLKRRPQWVRWRYEERDGYFTKVPYCATAFKRASSSDLLTWSTFGAAWAGLDVDSFDGIGFMFCSGDPFVGIDLDKCRDPETGEIEEWAREILESFENAVHVEVSPSGRGIHLITRGQLTKGFNRDQVEMYAQCRFFTVTGRVL